MAYRCPNCTRRTNISFTWTKPRPWYCEHCGSLLALRKWEVAHPRRWQGLISVALVVAPFTLIDWLNRRQFGYFAFCYYVGVALFSLAIPRMQRVQIVAEGQPHCRNCGYDLTGNASGRCPECGVDVVLTK